jgi:hypothetical protein
MTHTHEAEAFPPMMERIWDDLYSKHLIEKGVVESALSHYTTAQGLYNIVATGELWMSDARSTNDPTEGTWAWSLFDELLESARQKDPHGDVTPEEVRLVRSILETHDTTDAKLFFRADRMYIGSFSKDADDMGQWRAYADDGRGFCITIAARDLALPDNTSWARVIYEEEKQVFVLAYLIRSVAEEMKAHACAEGNSACEDWWISMVQHLVARIRPFFKHRAYTHEQEWRLVVHEDKWAEKKASVRATRSRLLSYVPMKMQRKEDYFLPITKVTIGPAQTDEATKDSVACLLDSSRLIRPQEASGYIEIEKSVLPYRSLR